MRPAARESPAAARTAGAARRRRSTVSERRERRVRGRAVTGAGVSADYSTATAAVGFGADELHVERRARGRAGQHGRERRPDAASRARPRRSRTAAGSKGSRSGACTLGRIDWGTRPSASRRTGPVTVTGADGDGEATWTGKGATRSRSTRSSGSTSSRSRCPRRRASSPGLVYEDLASGLRVELFAGAVKGLWARDFAIRMGKETTFEAATDKPSIGFGQFDALRFTAAFGKSFQVGGVLTSPAVQGPRARSASRSWARTRTRSTCGTLTLTDGMLTTPDGSVRDRAAADVGPRHVRVARARRATSASRTSRCPDLVLGEIKWKFKGGAGEAARAEARCAGSPRPRASTATPRACASAR